MMQTAEPVVIMTHAELDAIIQRAVKAATVAVSKPVPDADKDLWDAKRCAEYFGISAYTWSQVWAHRAGAPEAVVFGAGPKARRRWKADDVKEWAARQ